MLFKTLFAISVLALAGCQSDPQSTLKDPNRGSNAQRILFGEGASNTAGYGASFSFVDLVRFHLIENDIDLQKTALKGKKVLISLDYFFPTNFPEYSKLKVDDDLLGDGSSKIQNLVQERIDGLLERYDAILMADLFDPAKMNRELRSRLAKKENLPLKTIADALGEAEGVNSIVNCHVQVHCGDRFRLLSMNYFAGQLLANGGYSTDSISLLNRVPLTLRTDELFYDSIHLNDQGQIAAFNLVVRDQLQDLAGVKIPLMKQRPMPMDVGMSSLSKIMIRKMIDPWRSKVIKKVTASREQFLQGEANSYWARFSDVKQFGIDRVRRVGLESGTQVAKDLEAIAKSISKSTVSQQGAGHMVELRSSPRGAVLNFDLIKTLFFTKIDLTQQEDGTYVGFGYDYWSSIKPSVPSVNYAFRARVEGETIRVNWRIYPLLEDAEGSQEKVQLREGFLNDRWQKLLEQKGDDLPYIEFDYDLTIGF